MAGLLVQLSQAFADGRLDRETYRTHRAELIDSILNSEEEITLAAFPDTDVTVRRDPPFAIRDSNSRDISIPPNPGLIRWRGDVKNWLVVGAIITAILIIGLLYVSRGDSGDVSQARVVPKLVDDSGLPVMEVLQTDTHSMLAVDGHAVC